MDGSQLLSELNVCLCTIFICRYASIYCCSKMENVNVLMEKISCPDPSVSFAFGQKTSKISIITLSVFYVHSISANVSVRTCMHQIY